MWRGTDPAAVTAYEQWLGRHVDLAVDTSARGTWNDITSSDYLFQAWQGTGRRLVLAVAMLPTDDSRATMTAGAAGDYNSYFRTLGQNLVRYGFGDAILRVGWEFNLSGSRWSTSDPATFVAYWRQVVDTMRAVPGQHFRFDWNVNNGSGSVRDPVNYYPGDSYVDYVGVDAYDVVGDSGAYPIPDGCQGACAQQRREAVWQHDIYGGDRGLRFWSQFARAHDKQLSLPEWGVWRRNDGTGGGDDPYYIQQMAAFVHDPANAVGYQAYFEDSNELGTHRLMTGTQFPDAARAYRELFGG